MKITLADFHPCLADFFCSVNGVQALLFAPRGFAARSRVLARLVLLAQIGELVLAVKVRGVAQR